jgi:hypothetical protein
MSAWAIALATLVCAFGGAMVGHSLRTVLSGDHLSEDTKDVVKLVTGLIATLSALVLGLLIASAKSSFDAVNDGLEQAAAQVIVLDRLLARYGPGAKSVRTELRGVYAARVDHLLAGGSMAGSGLVQDAGPIERLEASVRALAAADDEQRSMKMRAHQILADITQIRWLGFERSSQGTPRAFLVVLVSWLTAMFLSFGLFAPRTPVALIALAIGALAVSTAIFLIEEMARPLDGVISISAEPLRRALAVLGQ